jgi:microcystin-dependent protein
MSEPYMGQLMLASFNFAPKGYLQCNGQLLPINQYSALFSLLQTKFGGNGVNTFALPNLQGRTPVGFGQSFVMGQVGGEETHTLTEREVPNHSHQIFGGGTAAAIKPNNALLGSGGTAIYTPATSLVTMKSATLTAFGSSQPHENRQPYLVMNWCIAVTGIYPSRS